MFVKYVVLQEIKILKIVQHVAIMKFTQILNKPNKAKVNKVDNKLVLEWIDGIEMEMDILDDSVENVRHKLKCLKEELEEDTITQRKQ